MRVMQSRNDPPAWQTDLKWLCGLLFLIALLIGSTAFVQARLTRPDRAEPVIARMLTLTLLPETLAAAVETGPADDTYQPGQPLQLLPGVQITADPSEIASFTAQDASNRIAGVLTERILTSGSDSALELVQNQAVASQLRTALEGPVQQLIAAQLGASLLPAGLGDGSRAADWRTQAANRPGVDVQPIVGVFVTLPAAQVEQMNAAQIGDHAVNEIATTLVGQGTAAARELFGNAGLLEIFDATVAGTAGNSIHGLLRTLLLAHEPEMAARLAAAAAVQPATETEATSLGTSLVSTAELAGLSAGQAQELILSRLAARVSQQGYSGLAGALSDPQQLERAWPLRTALDSLSGAAGRAATRRAWLWGAVALVTGLLLAAFSRGAGRLVNPGAVIILAALPGLLVSRWLLALTPVAEAPVGSGLGQLAQLLQWAPTALPAPVLDGIQRDYLIMATAGAALVLLALVLLVSRSFSPRRRRL